MFCHLRFTKPFKRIKAFSGSLAICIISMPLPSSPSLEAATVSLAVAAAFFSSSAVRTCSLSSSGITDAVDTGSFGLLVADAYVTPSIVSSMASIRPSGIGADSSLSVASINSIKALFSASPFLPVPIPSTLEAARTKSLNADATLPIGVSTPFSLRKKFCTLVSVSAYDKNSSGEVNIS